MYGYHRASTIRVLKEIVATLASSHLKAHLLKGLNEVFSRDSRKVAHATTATR